jgi:hypothetical protein
MEWIFNHGAHAVVTTSQLRTRGETPPIPTAALSRAFAVPAPPPLLDDPDFTITYKSSSSHSPNPLEFEHWSEDMLLDDSEDDSEDESDPEEDRYGHLLELETVSTQSRHQFLFIEMIV